ncbi:putative sugar transporter [Ixodes scapularis]
MLAAMRGSTSDRASLAPAQGGCLQLAITVGILYSFTVGRFLDWAWLALSCTIPALVLASLSQFCVESPRWLLLHDQRKRATEALRLLRSSEADVEDECHAIETTFASVRIPGTHVLLALHVMFLQQFSGINMIIFYASTTFANAGLSLAASDVSILVGVLQRGLFTGLRFFQVAAFVRRILGADPRSKALFHDRAAWGARTQVAATAVAVSLMDVIGRRRMLLASALVCTASMLAMGLLDTLGTPSASGAPPTMAERLPVPLMAFFVAGFSLGLGPVTWLLAAELVPLRDHGLLMGVTCAFNWACAFAVTLFFESVHTTFKFSGLGWFFSSVSLVGSLLVAMFLPETSRRSLEQILIEAPRKEPVELPSVRTGQISTRRGQ